jgi:hypothetical protein
MDITKTLSLAAALIVICGATPTHTQAAEGSPAASLSAALGGSLGEGMLDAGGVGHGRLTVAALRLARSEAFRRHVALSSQPEASRL